MKPRKVGDIFHMLCPRCEKRQVEAKVIKVLPESMDIVVLPCTECIAAQGFKIKISKGETTDDQQN